MRPILFHLGPIAVSSYFTMLGIGMGLAAWVALRWARSENIPRGTMWDFLVAMVLAGLAGAKLLHIVADGYFWDYVHLCTAPEKVTWHVDQRECLALGGRWDAAATACHPAVADCWAWASGSGFAFYGGFAAATAVAWWFVRRHGWHWGKVCDMAGTAIPLGLAWGRMGCFLAGCCFGTRWEHGIAFPPGSPAARHHWLHHLLPTYRTDSLPVHPTQLYEAGVALLLFAAATWWVRPAKRYDGQVFVFFATGYAIFRFFVEFIRSDDRGIWGPFSTSQWIAVAALAGLWWLRRYFLRHTT